MSLELSMLLAASLVSALQMFPYAVAYYRHWGIAEVFANRSNTPALPEWAERARRAHHNTVENMVHFIPLVLAIEFTHSNNDVTGMAAVIFVCARVLYILLYTLGVKWWRSISYTTGFAAEAVMLWQLIQHLGAGQ